MDINFIFIATFMLLFFFVLLRESIIDFKIEYVPNNIIIETYLVAGTFLIIYSILNKSFTPLLNGVITFGLVFLAALFIAVVGYIQAKIAEKRSRKKGEEKVIEIDISESKEENKKIKKQLKEHTKIILLACYGAAIASVIGLFQKYYSPLFVTSILVFIFLLSCAIYWKSKNIDSAVYCFGFGLVFCFALTKIFTQKGFQKDILPELIIAIVLSFVLELILNKIFKQFYETGGQLVDEKGFLLPLDQQPQEIVEDSKVTFAIGGGDMILFGGMALIVGLEGLLTIFVNSSFVFFALMIGFAILKRENLKVLPFVPSIAIGYIMYFSGFNILNLSILMSQFMN